MSSILLVENNTELRFSLKDNLKDSFLVHEAGNTHEAWDKTMHINPEIILSSISYAKSDGLDFCHKIKNNINTAHIPVVLLSQHASADIYARGLEAGADACLTYPLNINTLTMQLRNLLQTQSNLYMRLRALPAPSAQPIEMACSNDLFMKKVVDIIHRNIDSPDLNVEMLSKELGYSSNRVYRKIKTITAQTAKELIRTQRIKTSANLLLHNKGPITEIVYRVGFSSPSYFSRCFRGQYGCTPKEFITRYAPSTAN